jgi:hypothetical protein
MLNLIYEELMQNIKLTMLRIVRHIFFFKFVKNLFHLSIYKLKLMDIEMVPYKHISIVPVNYSSPY